MSELLVADELLKLKSLLDAGVLSQAEFDQQKHKLLNENDDELVQENTVCLINGTKSVDLKDVLDIVKSGEGGIGQILSDKTGLRMLDQMGLKGFIESEKKIPAKYFTGLPLETLKRIESGIEDYDTYDTTIARGPKCPTCGSTSISRIGTVGRTLSVGAFGLASGKIGKSFKCRSCGYTW